MSWPALRKPVRNVVVARPNGHAEPGNTKQQSQRRRAERCGSGACERNRALSESLRREVPSTRSLPWARHLCLWILDTSATFAVSKLNPCTSIVLPTTIDYTGVCGVLA